MHVGKGVFYQGEYKDVCCTKCDAFWYKEGNKLFLVKMLKHFLIIPRLQRMFKTPTMLNFIYDMPFTKQ
jgi:hypothetical protein